MKKEAERCRSSPSRSFINLAPAGGDLSIAGNDLSNSILNINSDDFSVSEMPIGGHAVAKRAK
ncbi:hypothetical protein B9T19_06040 [Ignatzschineria sp. F8392]|uniref:hypothetical protein n=1 Tax=Ignatzschineria sp. F8392 TaxID=1980117 RepID=UPI000B990875|nr:hypothetical protein [Ignatzschineria sp. F8392]OYQ79334.1 hypothetical protein B9T19_06040 [Ignatzschineria sp. F8392]